MMQLSDTALNTVDDIARRFNLSRDAVLHMLDAVQQGGGTMAQFNHPELGGGGQWMQGGMTMVGDMFNHQLKFTVDNLCLELGNLLATQPFISPPPPLGGSAWWPLELGQPSASGSQNAMRYAYFPGPCRLAIETYGTVRLYDTGPHQIQGVSQQQGGGQDLSFSSQFGMVSLAQLPEVSLYPNSQTPEPSPIAEPEPEPITPLPMSQQPVMETPPPAPPVPPPEDPSLAILTTLEKLAELHQRGILSEAEFSAKKAELLARL